MKCVICKTGEASPGTTTVVLNREEVSIIIKNVPADVCDTCGEYYLSDETAEIIFARAEEAVAKGAEVEILRYAA